MISNKLNTEDTLGTWRVKINETIDSVEKNSGDIEVLNEKIDEVTTELKAISEENAIQYAIVLS